MAPRLFIWVFLKTWVPHDAEGRVVWLHRQLRTGFWQGLISGLLADTPPILWGS